MDFTEGKIIVYSWGYEQTNQDFYKILKRQGDYVTIVEMDYKETYDARSMTGTKVPTEIKTGAKPFRRKVHSRDGKESGIAIESYGWGNLWDGDPAHYSTYA
jgi:hypothetical protein